MPHRPPYSLFLIWWWQVRGIYYRAKPKRFETQQIQAYSKHPPKIKSQPAGTGSKKFHDKLKDSNWNVVKHRHQVECS